MDTGVELSTTAPVAEDSSDIVINDEEIDAASM